MRKAAHRVVDGPAASDRVAAGGGLEVPRGVPPQDTERADESAAASALIPGAREADTLTHREPAAIGGLFTGADIPSDQTEWLDRTTAIEHRREGGESLQSATRHVDRQE